MRERIEQGFGDEHSLLFVGVSASVADVRMRSAISPVGEVLRFCDRAAHDRDFQTRHLFAGHILAMEIVSHIPFNSRIVRNIMIPSSSVVIQIFTATMKPAFR